MLRPNWRSWANITKVDEEDLLPRSKPPDYVKDFFGGVVQHLCDGSLAEIETVV